jgi:pentatricopeptide repeat protein
MLNLYETSLSSITNPESQPSMLANVDIVLSASAVIAISVVSSLSWRICCWDLVLFLSAIGVYLLASQHFKLKKPASCACQESLAKPVWDGLDDAEESSEEDSSVEPGVQLPSPACDSVASAVDDDSQQQIDCSEQIALMRKFASARNIAGTMRIFRSLKQKSSVMYNIVLRAWIGCGNMPAADDWMDQIREAGMADVDTFNTMIKFCVDNRALDKARSLLQEMQDGEIQPNVTTFNELVIGCANNSRIHEGLTLLEMQAENVQPSSSTIEATAKLLNSTRDSGQSERVQQILRKFKIMPDKQDQWVHTGTKDTEAHCNSAFHGPVPVPRLAAVISQADVAQRDLSIHEVNITGDLPQIKSVRRTLKQHGLLDTDTSDAWPLNGHWETDHGLTVILEGKVVRWSRQRASKLSFVGHDRRSCILTLYGAPTRGQLVTPGLVHGATKSLRWDSGDVWHSYDGRVISQATFFAQSMTKPVRDEMEDQAYRARSEAVLKCVSRDGLCIPTILMDNIVEFLGNNLYNVRVCFESRWTPKFLCYDEEEDEADPFHMISRRNPRVGFRHCWVEPGSGWYGQRSLVNGEEVDEDDFSRHVKAVRKA